LRTPEILEDSAYSEGNPEAPKCVLETPKGRPMFMYMTPKIPDSGKLLCNGALGLVRESELNLTAQLTSAEFQG